MWGYCPQRSIALTQQGTAQGNTFSLEHAAADHALLQFVTRSMGGRSFSSRFAPGTL
jgi:hypothetical protein